MSKPSQKTLSYKVYKYILNNRLVKAGDRVIVALSGGPDSMCLLNILLELKENLDITVAAAHFNHRMRGEASDRDQEFVQKYCHSRGIECYLGIADKKTNIKSEDEARKARYAFFEKILREGRGDKVAIAHNANDFAETFLLRIIRGTGLKGLKSIPSQREKFIRPLLSTSRDEIISYLKNRKIKYCTDLTNENIEIDRNYLRLKVMPILKVLNPNIVETVQNSALIIAKDYEFLDKQAIKEYERIVEIGKNAIMLDRKNFLNLDPVMQRMVLRKAIEKNIGTLENITLKQLTEVLAMVEKGTGRKFKLLPCSLRIELNSGKILISNKSR